MPLYEYKCDKCGDVFEVMQKFSDEPLTVHSKCGGVVHRLLSAPALQFKGSGWYVTDYARSGGAESKKKDGAETKTDNKPSASESKPESKPAETKSSTTEKSKTD